MPLLKNKQLSSFYAAFTLASMTAFSLQEPPAVRPLQSHQQNLCGATVTSSGPKSAHGLQTFACVSARCLYSYHVVETSQVYPGHFRICLFIFATNLSLNLLNSHHSHSYLPQLSFSFLFHYLNVPQRESNTILTSQAIKVLFQRLITSNYFEGNFLNP